MLTCLTFLGCCTLAVALPVMLASVLARVCFETLLLQASSCKASRTRACRPCLHELSPDTALTSDCRYAGATWLLQH